MLVPSIFRDNLLGNFFSFPFDGYGAGNLMGTDIKGMDNDYGVAINMPGAKKEDIKIGLRDGYLTIQVSIDSSKKEKDSNGRYIRKRRYSGFCSRSSHVRDAVTQEDIKAKLEDGTLELLILKEEVVSEVEERKYIATKG